MDETEFKNAVLSRSLYFQQVQKALELDSLVAYIDSLKKNSAKKNPEVKRLNGFQEVFSKNNIDESKTWIKDILEKETSDEDESEYNEKEKNRNYVNFMLKEHSYHKKLTSNLCNNYDQDTNHLKNIHFEKMKENLYYSTPLLSGHECSDFEDFRQIQFGHSALNVNHGDKIKPKINIQQNILPPKIKVKSERKIRREKEAPSENINSIKNEGKLVITLSKNSIQPLPKAPDIIKTPRPNISVLNQSKAPIPLKEVADKNRVKKGLTNEQCISRRKKLWQLICRKEIPRAFKQKLVMKKESCHNIKKMLKEFQRELKRMEMESQRRMKEQNMKAKKLAKEMMVLCRNKEKVEKEQRKKAEKEALEQKKIEVEMRETRRQNRKLNFLITQTELYAHFMAGKIAQGGVMADGSGVKSVNNILSHFDEDNTPDDDYDSCQMKQQALSNVKDAIKSQINAQKEFDIMGSSRGVTEERGQPSIFKGTLKSYQLKGMNWLATLYDQGINGILADEMGLGKTVQTISFFAHLAEDQGTWGPFLIVAPASTLHNWQQEVTRFVPSFKVVPYWGTASDRKILRKIWNTSQSRKNPININGKDSSFHVLVTSYQLVVQDCKYFQQVNWHYMVLDEAQAIKSSASSRWKSLLEFKCRNRLLLTGTPIQNSMAELWSLLHFIMPTLFDCHTEFKEWFSKDIENHVEKHSSIDTQQLSRLHLILKPFMLRRIKKDVENELSEKIEIQLSCPLTLRQKLLYKAIKERISIDDLYQSSSSSSSSSFSTTNLMNIFMQLRKVCNHPELFERKEVRSPYHFTFPLFYLPRLLFTHGLWAGSKESLCTRLMYIFHPHHIHLSLFHPCHTHSRNIHSKPSHFQHSNSSTFSFTRFTSLSPSELHAVFEGGMLERARHSSREKSLRQLSACRHLFKTSCHLSFHTHSSHYATIEPNKTSALIRPSSSSSSPPPVQQPSSLITSVFETYPQEFCFIHPTNTIHTHTDHHIIGGQDQSNGDDFVIKNMSSSGVLQKDEDDKELKAIDITKPCIIKSSKKTYHLLPTYLPTFIAFYKPKVISRGSSDHYTCDRRAEWQRLRCIDRSLNRLQYNYLLYGLHLEDGAPACENMNEKKLSLINNAVINTTTATNDTTANTTTTNTNNTEGIISHTSTSSSKTTISSRPFAGPQLIATPIISPLPLGGIMASPHHSFIDIPSKESLVVDAGKLTVLDKLLKKLKKENHRTLIYSQMTKVIDLLEEFLWLRKYTYIRLDGSSKISDRRDMVADFQSRSDIFVFLLSTRAGGIGINLTAADTVIFYDSDWNPTVDQQAMDRSHRLGQTKQVTVYRLICDGTIEERILQRAKEKSEIQRMVISGGTADVLRPKEMMSLLLDADEFDCKLTGMLDGQDNLFLNRKRPYKSNRGRPSKKLCVDSNNIKKPNNNNNDESLNTSNRTKFVPTLKIT